MKGLRLFHYLAAAVLTLALSVSAWGQATTSLGGLVTDPSGARVPNAKITLTNQATDISRVASTRASGEYDFASVLPGTYTVTVEAQGFRTYVQKGVVLQVSLPATLNVALQVGAVTQAVEVTAVAPLMNTTDASLGKTVGVSAITQLPLPAENMVLLLSYQPGVVFTGQNETAYMKDVYDTRAGAVNGERSDQNNITLDGVSNNNEFQGYAFIGVLPTTQFSVEEFRVTTSNYGVSEGRSAGAQIAMVTKGGTNQFHGTLYEFNRTQFGEANDYFLKMAQMSSGEPNKPPHLVRNIFGGTLGGPILKDRLFFFFNYEGHRQSQAASVVRTIPTATLRDGIIQYQCEDSTLCPGMTVAGVSGQSYTIQPGFYALGPAELTAMDPYAGGGPNTAVLNYMQRYPLPNDTSVGNIVNTSGYRFGAPTTLSNNWYIARLDYKLTSSGNHTLFWRGTAIDDHIKDPPFLPGEASMNPEVDLNKGFVAGYTGILRSNLVNTFRYGLTRESTLTAGTSNQPWVEFREIDMGITRSTGVVAPVHNFADNVNWLKGSHNIKFGTNILLARRNTFSDANSFSDALTNADWVISSGLANKGDALDPAVAGYPAVASTFGHSYDFPLAAMMGFASEVDARYNFFINSPTDATALAQGAPLTRHWATGNYNFYFEDTWRARSNLSITYGLNYQYMTPVTETAGQQVLPNVTMGDWFEQRRSNMLQGIPSSQDELISFVPGGSHWGKAGLYSSQNANFAPRVGVAWSPHPSDGWLKTLMGEDKTVIRGGFGVYYSNFGPELALTYDRVGEFGLAATLQNPAGILDIAEVPRVTDMNVIPATDNNGNPMIASPPSSAYPAVYTGVEAIARGIDQSLQTPYSLAADFSIERQLPGNMVLDLAYVGHFGHRLLDLDDIATPLDLVDPKSGISYFAAASRFSELARQGVDPATITASMVGPTAAFWQNLVALRPGTTSYSLCNSGTTNDPLVAAYALFECTLYNETTGLYRMDINSSTYTGRRYPTFNLGYNSFYNPQYSSLYVWRSIGYSNYHSFQAGLHRQISSGVLFGFNYTLSKSLDVESLAERGQRSNAGVIINAWSPYQLYGPSDFDVRHQMNGYWVAQLPFGHGKTYGSGVGPVANAFIGGWQLSGTGRWTSGYPTNVFMAYVWPTNWEEMGQANRTSVPISTGNTIASVPNIYTDPAAALAGWDYAYPGQSGVRNAIRGDGMFNIDMSLSKSFTIHESQKLQFRWNVYNVTNSVRFDSFTAQPQWDVSNTFGNYSQTLTTPRVMEFSLVYQF